MALIVICEFWNYEPWSGAVKNFRKLEKVGKVDDFERLLEELYPEGVKSVQINDLLWFDFDFIKEQLGISEEEEQEEEE